MSPPPKIAAQATDPAASPAALKPYLVITLNYWAFTISDGALRMLLLLHFYQQGYSALALSLLFMWYEIFGVVTNLVGGWLGARIGLNKTMQVGLLLQVMALLMLLPPEWLTMSWVMLAQAGSGIAKDLNKMSAKSALKLLVPAEQQQKLYQWVAWFTGSKNALKGLGFFIGGALLSLCGFQGAVLCLAAVLALVWLLSLWALPTELGKSSFKPKFAELWSHSPAVNRLAGARMLLFAARDVWFVVALPLYLAEQANWSFSQIGAFLACWIIGYGIVQTLAPRWYGRNQVNLTVQTELTDTNVPSGQSAWYWVSWLCLLPALISIGMSLSVAPLWILLGGLLLFAIIFAMNSAVHSYLIVAYARADGVSLDVGFYYMANALGRLAGTLLSGWVYQLAGLSGCLWIASLLLLLCVLVSRGLKSPEPL